MIILTTERITLRTLHAGDAAFYLELLNEPAFVRNIGDKGVRTLEQARAAILDGPVTMQMRLGHSLYLMERRGDGAPLGLCGLIKRDTLPDVDIGYALAPAHWGRGYAYEAGAAVVEYARSHLRLPRLLAITSPDNTPSNQLLEKLGLRFVQLTRLGESDEDIRLYRLEFAPLLPAD